jgi:hypothetical protein
MIEKCGTYTPDLFKELATLSSATAKIIKIKLIPGTGPHLPKNLNLYESFTGPYSTNGNRFNVNKTNKKPPFQTD